MVKKEKQNQLKSNLIESKLIFHSDTDAAAAGAAAGAAAASAAATVATTIKMVVKTKAAAQLQQQQQHLCLNEKIILIQLNLISIDFVFFEKKVS